MADWDCAGSLDLGRFEAVLRGVKAGGGEVEGEEGDGDGEGEGEEGVEGLLRQGNFEPAGDGGGDGDGDGVHGVKGVIRRETIERLQRDVRTWWPPSSSSVPLHHPNNDNDNNYNNSKGNPPPPPPPPLVIVDGFLLFGRSVPASLRDLFDVKILLRADKAEAKRRRERRNGYVTLEGFWRDPEGYFEDVVWPGWVREHGFLLVGEGDGGGGGGEGEGGKGKGGKGKGGGKGGGGTERVFEEEGVWRVFLSDPGWGLEECLEWVVGVVRGRVEGG